MGSALVYVFVVVVVAGLVFLAVSLIFGRGEELAPLPPSATPTRLPGRDLSGQDVQGLRFQQVLRGYKMSEVDWALGRLAGEVDVLRAQVAELSDLVERGSVPADGAVPTDGIPEEAIGDPALRDPALGDPALGDPALDRNGSATDAAGGHDGDPPQGARPVRANAGEHEGGR